MDVDKDGGCDGEQCAQARSDRLDGYRCLGTAARRLHSLPGQQGGNAQLDLLYVADTLDARQPGQAVVPATRLGRSATLGRAPWMTGRSASIAYPQLAPLLDARQATTAQLGGYAVLAALLEQLRGEAGAGNSLTLENGQGWNGSGLAYLTQGESGVQGSQLLGIEARVSSDERVLWPRNAARACIARPAPLPSAPGQLTYNARHWVCKPCTFSSAAVPVSQWSA